MRPDECNHRISTVAVHCAVMRQTQGNSVCENAEFGQHVRMYEAIVLLAISQFMLVAVLAFAVLSGLNPNGSPAEVIKTFYFACNNGNYSVAEQFLVPEVNRVLTRHIGAVDGGLREICDEATKQGHLQRVEILQQDVRGEVAKVRYRLYYADGSAIEDSQGLVAKRWVWKIAP